MGLFYVTKFVVLASHNGMVGLQRHYPGGVHDKNGDLGIVKNEQIRQIHDDLYDALRSVEIGGEKALSSGVVPLAVVAPLVQGVAALLDFILEAQAETDRPARIVTPLR